jgi:hypothetical protein
MKETQFVPRRDHIFGKSSYLFSDDPESWLHQWI